MEDPATEDQDVSRALDRIAAILERQEKSLAMIESRIALVHEDARRLGEMVVRVKLAGDNLKRLALRHNEALVAIEARLGPCGDGGSA